MLDALKLILEIQELDMKMLRLIKLRKERNKELENVTTIQKDLNEQVQRKQEEIQILKKESRAVEREIDDASERIKKLEHQQQTLKKADEFSAMSQAIAQAEREKLQHEHRHADIGEKILTEEEFLSKLQESLKVSQENVAETQKEIEAAILDINEEGKSLKIERDELAKQAPEDLLAVYTRLLTHKKDRVVVPIEGRACSGCHILVTAQHENLVRKAERLVFCEHCSRIHYWHDLPEFEQAGAKKRRRKAANA